MRRSNFALRLQPSLLEEARKLAEMEAVALNQFINVAVAEKLSAPRTESYFVTAPSVAISPERSKSSSALASATRRSGATPFSGANVRKGSVRLSNSAWPTSTSSPRTAEALAYGFESPSPRIRNR